MSGHPIARPGPNEYAEFYAGYVVAAPGDDPIAELERQAKRVVAGFNRMTREELTYRYAPGKWSPLQILGHINDSERIFSYRALRFARGDATALPGMDQDEFVDGADFDTAPVSLLISEFNHLRAANVALWKTLDDAAVRRRGTASDCPFTVRALIWIILGHTEHHLGVLADSYDLADRFAPPAV
ncbi:MAG: DinB family protein [Rhodothermales bacterium]|nr:DinB family protein [Rhodothermales bacterium]